MGAQKDSSLGCGAGLYLSSNNLLFVLCCSIGLQLVFCQLGLDSSGLRS